MKSLSKITGLAGVTVVGYLVTVGGLFAAPIVLNGSFEVGTTGTAVYQAPPSNTGTASPWILTGDVIVQQFDFVTGNPNYLVGVTDGVRALAFNPGDSTPDAVVSQSFLTTIGITYTLTFDFGKYGEPPGIAGLAVSVSSLANLLSTTVTDSTGSLYDLSGGPASTYSPYSFNFTADSVLTTLSFTDISQSGGLGFDTALDNVVVTPVAVPEPSTLTLIPIALLALIRRRRLHVRNWS